MTTNNSLQFMQKDETDILCLISFLLFFMHIHCNRDILRCIPSYILKQVSVEAGNPLRYSCNRSVMNLYTSKRDGLILPEEIRRRRH